MKILAAVVTIATLLWVSSSIVWANDTLKLIVSIIPQEYFVTKIGGDLVDVSAMVPPGSNPATYEPKPQQMVALTKAKIYFAIGVAFEKVWLEKFANINSKMIIVHTEDGIEKIPMKAHHHPDNGGPHPNDEIHHGIKDPHIWLSPPLVMTQSRNILDALLKVDPANSEMYEANHRSFIGEVVDLDLMIRSIFSEKGKGSLFMVYHPAWGYFAKSYGLEQSTIEMEGKEATARELQNLVRYAREKDVNVIFVQPQFSAKSAHIIAKAIGCKVMFADPLALNWSDNLLKVANNFRAVLK